MRDVHPPEQGIHTLKDFSLHLLTITVGLLIALGRGSGPPPPSAGGGRADHSPGKPGTIRASAKDGSNGSQALFEGIQQQTLDEYLQLDSYFVRGFDPSKFNSDDIKTALPVVRRAPAHLIDMLDVIRGALTVYDNALR